MGKALYRTYRSKSLAEIVGQEHIVGALKNALKSGAFSHAYLFTGPKGTGKTSIARILAHEINKLPYTGENNHIDIIEIDAASNRRIDEIRDLRDKVHIAPAMAKYKVYIIDEVHMLTREAFNALLKTLEEPPAHVVFILATTEAHKLPETIISRTQRYSFKPVEQKKIIAHLKTIAKSEKINISDDALQLIAEHGEGSFRDSISLLDQFSNMEREVTLDDVRASLGLAPDTLVKELAQKLGGHNPSGLAISLANARDTGVEPAQIAKQLSANLRQSLIDGSSQIEHDKLVRLLEQLIEVPASREPASYLEIVLLDAAFGQNSPKPAETEPAPAKPNATKVKAASTMPSSDVITEPHPSKVRSDSKKNKIEGQPKNSQPAKLLDNKTWTGVLNRLRQKYGTLHSILKLSTPVFGESSVTISCSNAFNKKRLEDPRNKQVIVDTIHEVVGSHVEIICEIGSKSTKPAETESKHSAAPDAVNTISNIFGGVEVLDS